ncbi:hypothetical protein AAG570_008605 [Ranatra chinensis]|uniref:Uncharacterized protein n=1 Tax=Ranatra chinensis TaxID=642074 RepID=A0ABD0YRG3_9HEMI
MGPPTAKTVVVRNLLPWPQIKDEENFKEPLIKPGFEYDWFTKVPTGDRLYNQLTLSIIRKDHRMKQPHAPKDSLDISMSSVYDHSNQAFQGKSEVLRQPDTAGREWYRLHRNVRVLPIPRPARDQLDDEIADMPHSNSIRPGTRFFGVKIGGEDKKMSPFSVKMGISSIHGYSTAPGYSRKPDGTYYST